MVEVLEYSLSLFSPPSTYLVIDKVICITYLHLKQMQCARTSEGYRQRLPCSRTLNGSHLDWCFSPAFCLLQARAELKSATPDTSCQNEFGACSRKTGQPYNRIHCNQSSWYTANFQAQRSLRCSRKEESGCVLG